MYIILAGHYNFPGQPSHFALNSMKAASEFQKEKRKSNVVLYDFINDMRYTNLCNYGYCSINTVKEERYDVDHENKSCYQPFINELKHCLFRGGIIEFANYFDNHCEEVFSKNDMILPQFINLKDICQVVVQDCQDIHYQDSLSFRQYYDDFMYTFNKDGFVPFLYEIDLNIQCKTLYEKNVFNSVSKVLKKMKRSNPDLCFNTDHNRIVYECEGFDGNRITLRVEEESENFRAINKCPAIIGNLYYRVVKANPGHNKYMIVYHVPSYDRNKVNLGAQVFFNLFYPYLFSRGEKVEVQIMNSSWADDQCDFSMTDVFTNNYCTHYYNQLKHEKAR